MSTKKSSGPDGIDPKGNPYQILVVDDEDITRKLIVRILQSVAFEVCGEAVNGQAAVAVYKIQNPDIVTLDVRMPVMDGLEALKQIKEVDEYVIAIMLTNEASKDVVKSLLDAGAKDYLLKPLSRKSVLDKIRRARPETAKARRR